MLHFFNTYANPLEARKYFISLVTDTFAFREKNNVIRKDFMQMLMQLRNAGKVSEDGDWTVGKSEGLVSLSINDCAAQSYLFYLAGFDTSSSALTYCLYELVRNPELLLKVQQEIDQTLSRHNDEVTYEAIQEMKYLELCILGDTILSRLHNRFIYYPNRVFNRIGPQVSNTIVAQSHLHQGLCGAQVGSDHSKGNANHHFVVGYWT